MFNSSRLLSVGSIIALLIASFGFAYSVSAAPTSGGPPSVVQFERLGPGRVLVRWSNGVVYTGSPVVQVDMTTWTNADGTAGGGHISFATGSNLQSKADVDQAADAYRTNGRSPAQDEATLREIVGNNAQPAKPVPSPQQVMPNAGTPFTSGCLYTGSNAYVSGSACFVRYDGPDNDPSKYYIADASYADGYAITSSHNLTKLQVSYGYNVGVDIVQANPLGTQPISSCNSWNFGVSAWGGSIGYTKTVCPQSIAGLSISPTYIGKWGQVQEVL